METKNSNEHCVLTVSCATTAPTTIEPVQLKSSSPAVAEGLIGLRDRSKYRVSLAAHLEAVLPSSKQAYMSAIGLVETLGLGTEMRPMTRDFAGRYAKVNLFFSKPMFFLGVPTRI